jgi:hypothetical protein
MTELGSGHLSDEGITFRTTGITDIYFHFSSLRSKVRLIVQEPFEMDRKIVVCELPGSVILRDSPEPCFAPKVKAAAVAGAEFGAVTYDSFEAHGISHFSQFTVTFEQNAFNSLEHPVPPAAELSHTCHPQQAPVLSIGTQCSQDLVNGFYLDELARS